MKNERSRKAGTFYKIKPLEWTLTVHGATSVTIDAYTPFGSYTIRANNVSGVSLGYCFTEHYDEGQIAVTSVRNAKQKAQADFLNRLSPILKPILR